MQSVLLPVHLIGAVSERALILYALMLDRAKSSAVRSAFHDSDGVPFVIFTVDEVMRTFKIGQCQARATIKELEFAGLIVGKVQGLRQPKHYYIAEVTAEKSAVKTAEKSAVKTAEKSAVKTAEKSAVNQSINNQSNLNQFHQSGGEICENQTSFDDIFLEMTMKDAVSKIVAQVVAENSKEFPEITSKIADFIAENVRNARKNTKIRNLRAYVRACLGSAVADYNAQQDTAADPGGYKATYDIAAYESESLADVKEWG